MPGDQRFTGGRFALDIMGANAGPLRKFEGLDMAADIVTNDVGPTGVQKKQVTNVRWTPARATISWNARISASRASTKFAKS